MAWEERPGVWPLFFSTILQPTCFLTSASLHLIHPFSASCTFPPGVCWPCEKQFKYHLTREALCGILIENGLHRGIYPNVQSTVGGTVQEGVEGVALLDEMHIVGGRLQGVKRTHHSPLALFASFLWIMTEAPSYHFSTMPVCLLPYFLTWWQELYLTLQNHEPQHKYFLL